MLHFYFLAIWCYKEIAFILLLFSLSSSYMLNPYSLLHYFILLCFFFLSFSLVYQCLSVVQMKYHILLLSIYCGVLYFGCVLKYNHTMFYAFWGLCFSLKHVCISIISSSVFFSSDVLPFYFSFHLSLLWF